MNRPALATLLVAACSSAPPNEVKGDATAQPDMAVTPDAAVCVPFSGCDWLDSYERHIVAVLAGTEDVTPGVRLAHRASVAERDLARQFLID